MSLTPSSTEVSADPCAAVSTSPCWAPFGLSAQQALWLAFHIGQSLYTSGEVTSGRDIMRVIHARWDQMGLPVETLPAFEKAILRDDHPFSLATITVQKRAIRALAGDCPIGPLDRIS